MYPRQPGACHRATRYRWTFAEYSRTIFVAQPLGLHFPSPGSESKIMADESSHGAPANDPQIKPMLRVSSLGPGRVRIASHFRAEPGTGNRGQTGTASELPAKGAGNPWQSRQSPLSSLSARKGMLGSRIPPMHYFDLAIIIVYLVAITAFGARFRSGQKNLKDYFLGGRTAPWWAIGLSIVSAETSTLTIVGTPALAFGGNLGFLQIVLGYLLARIVISVVFLPQYFRGEMFTAYELM